MGHFLERTISSSFFNEEKFKVRSDLDVCITLASNNMVDKKMESSWRTKPSELPSGGFWILSLPYVSFCCLEEEI